MPLAAGMRLGPYEVIAAIGAGGMGEVYRAQDTRLDRTVAHRHGVVHRDLKPGTAASCSSGLAPA